MRPPTLASHSLMTALRVVSPRTGKLTVGLIRTVSLLSVILRGENVGEHLGNGAGRARQHRLLSDVDEVVLMLTNLFDAPITQLAARGQFGDEQFNGVAREPLLEFAFGTVGRLVRSRVAHVTVGFRLDERRTATGTGPLHGATDRRFDRVNVLAVDDLGGHVKGECSLRNFCNRGRARDRAVLTVKIVLTDEEHRKVPHRRQIECFVKGANVRRSVTEDTHRRAIALVGGELQCRTDGDGYARAHDGERGQQANVGVTEVHRSAKAAHATNLTAEHLAQHRCRLYSERQRNAVTAVRAADHVSGTSDGRQTDGHRLLTLGSVGRAADEALSEELLDPVLNETYLHHPFETAQAV